MAHDDNAYDGLIEAASDGRWAFGTGFTDPLHGIDTRLPDGVDPAALARFCLDLGDDALIMSQSLQCWVYRLPELEEEAAVANIALDLLGQARLLLARAALAEGAGRTEDDLAYLRTAAEFRNVRLAEREDADFADLIARLLVFSVWRHGLLTRLRGASDGVLASVAGKGVHEVRYHVDYASGWIRRLGDGTELSHTRMQAALDRVRPLLHALVDDTAAVAPAGLGCSFVGLGVWTRDTVTAIAESGTLSLAVIDSPPIPSRGDHDDTFDALITEMQSVARALPGATW